MEKYRRSIPIAGELVYDTITKTGSIAAGVTENYEITCPDGFQIIPVAIAFSVAAPSGAASGSHKLYIYPGLVPNELGVHISANYNVSLQMAYNDPGFSSTSFYPNDRKAFLEAMKNILAIPGLKIRMQYYNNSNVAQTGNRVYQIIYLKQPRA